MIALTILWEGEPQFAVVCENSATAIQAVKTAVDGIVADLKVLYENDDWSYDEVQDRLEDKGFFVCDAQEHAPE